MSPSWDEARNHLSSMRNHSRFSLHCRSACISESVWSRPAGLPKGAQLLEEPRACWPSWPQQDVPLPKPHPNNLFPCHALSQETCHIMSWPLEREGLIFQIVFQGTSSGRWRKKPRGRCRLQGCRLCQSPRDSQVQSHSAPKAPQIQGLPK